MLRRQLKPAMTPTHRPVLLHDTLRLKRQHHVSRNTTRQRTVEVHGRTRRAGEAFVEFRQKRLLPKMIRSVEIADLGQPQSFDQAILKDFMPPLDTPLRLRLVCR